MLVIEWLIKPIAEAIAAASFERALTHFPTVRAWVLHRKTSNHFHALEEKLRKMPYIYADLGPAAVLDEFETQALESLDLTSLRKLPTTFLKLSPEERIKNSRRALIMGGAGIGKTTFLRWTILDLIESKRDSKLFHDSEPLIPFYVPLREVQLGEKCPILEHLLRENALLRGGACPSSARGGENLGRKDIGVKATHQFCRSQATVSAT